MTLYEQLLGDEFARLPATAQCMHSREGRWRYAGDVEVERGGSLLSRLCGWATRLPPGGRGGIEVDIDAAGGVETWTRHVGAHAMRSTLRAHAGRLRERLGLVTFDFRLQLDEDDVLHWRVERVAALGIPLPAALFTGVHARESEREGRYRFEVRAALPGAGLLVHYRGLLHVD